MTRDECLKLACLQTQQRHIMSTHALDVSGAVFLLLERVSASHGMATVPAHCHQSRAAAKRVSSAGCFEIFKPQCQCVVKWSQPRHASQKKGSAAQKQTGTREEKSMQGKAWEESATEWKANRSATQRDRRETGQTRPDDLAVEHRSEGGKGKMKGEERRRSHTESHGAETH